MLLEHAPLSIRVLTWGVKLWDDTNASSLGISNDLLYLQPQDPGAQQPLPCPWRLSSTVCLPHEGEASSISRAQRWARPSCISSHRANLVRDCCYLRRRYHVLPALPFRICRPHQASVSQTTPLDPGRMEALSSKQTAPEHAQQGSIATPTAGLHLQATEPLCKYIATT